MNLSVTKKLSNEQFRQLFQLWNSEYPQQLVYPEISVFRSYLDGLINTTHYLLMVPAENAARVPPASTQSTGTCKQHILAWAFTFTRDGDRWFAILLKGACQRKGYGSLLLRRIKEDEQALNGWVTDHDRYRKPDHTPYLSPLAFYLKNDFRICPEVRLETEQLSAVKIHWSAR